MASPIHETTVRNVANVDQLDTDHDRRGDVCDSCPLTLPTRDRDDDGIDDACDSCVFGPQVDDDGDGTMDACDLCPATPGREQSDDDGDLIGNDCDSAVARDNQRALYDPFARIDPAWEGGGDWQLAADGTSLLPLLAGLSTLRRDTSDSAVFTVSATFEVAATGTVGVALTDTSQRCELRCTAGQCVLHAEELGVVAESSPVTVGVVTIKATVHHGGMLLPIFGCWLYRLDQTPVTLTLDANAVESDHTSVFASPGNKVFGADLVR